MDGHDNNGAPLMFYDNEWGYGSEDVKKFSLGHSCDRWVIGTIEEAEEFHRLLGDMIMKAKEKPDEVQTPGEDY